MSQIFYPGQRWLSSAEPELGVGIVIDVEERRVQIQFPASEELRMFVIDNAPLSRLEFNVGETIHDAEYGRLQVRGVDEQAGCLIYTAEDESGEVFPVPEQALSATLQFNGPRARLFTGQIDHPAKFELRATTLQHRADQQRSAVAGLLGPRVQLLPHQLYVADEISRRPVCRVLLADEVGLGKTIEAGLVLHRLLCLERVQRALVLVPGALLHQWLVEMLRRFNLQFTILDAERCEALTEHDDGNPFASAQLVLCAAEWLSEDALAAEHAVCAGWDMLIVDEAHHLQWSEQGEQSAEYDLVSDLAGSARHALFLTATPQKAGIAGHFGQLRLLDPERFSSLSGFDAEQQQYSEINTLIQNLDSVSSGDDPLLEALASRCDESSLQRMRAALTDGDAATIETARSRLQSILLDRFGTGRVLFRNTRSAVPGFPTRQLFRHTLDAQDAPSASATDLESLLYPEILRGDSWCASDARVVWLENFLKQHRRHKVLLICANDRSAEQLEEFLRLRRGLSTAIFSADMTLVERDRAAAWFADIEFGAQLLVCSEIGSEGRNFQFASHLVLFDLPLNPDLLEQRIGRLDRLGQQQDIEIHVPCTAGSAGERLAHWYHAVLDAFEQPCSHGYSVYQQFREPLQRWLASGDNAAGEALFAEAKTYSDSLRAELASGRNRLLELNSCHPARAADLIEQIDADEGGSRLAEYVEQLADQFGIETEHHSADAVILRPGDHMLVDAVPGLPDEGLSGTFDRNKALTREDLAWLTWEHPLIVAAMDLVLNNEIGSTSLVTINVKGLRPGSILVEAIYRFDIAAPASLQLSSHLQTPLLRLLFDDQRRSLGDKVSRAMLDQLRKPIARHLQPRILQQLRQPLADLIEQLDHSARDQAQRQAELARSSYAALREQEMDRLKALAQVNPLVGDTELEAFAADTRTGLEALNSLQCTQEGLRILVVEG